MRNTLWSAALLAAAGWAATATAEPPPRTPARETIREITRDERDVDLRPKFRVGQDIRLTMISEEQLLPAATTAPGSGTRPSQTPKNAPGSKPAPGSGTAPGKKPAPGIDPTPEAPREQVHKSKQEIGLKLHVVETSPEKGSKVQIVFERMVMKATIADQAVDFDSSRPADRDDLMGQMLRPMIGMAIVTDFDLNGNVRSMTTDAGAPAGLNPMGGVRDTGSAKDLVAGLLGPVNTRGGSTGIVKVGESWTSESIMQAITGTWKIAATQRLASSRAGRADIDIRGTVTLDNVSPGGIGAGAKISDSSYSGKAVWNTEVGMLESMDTTMRVTYERAAALDALDDAVPNRGTIEKKLRVTRN